MPFYGVNGMLMNNTNTTLENLRQMNISTPAVEMLGCAISKDIIDSNKSSEKARKDMRESIEKGQLEMRKTIEITQKDVSGLKQKTSEIQEEMRVGFAKVNATLEVIAKKEQKVSILQQLKDNKIATNIVIGGSVIIVLVILVGLFALLGVDPTKWHGFVPDNIGG